MCVLDNNCRLESLSSFTHDSLSPSNGPTSAFCVSLPLLLIREPLFRTDGAGDAASD